MARRTMKEHDVVIVDYSDLNAIAIVTDRSEDPKVTQGIGGPGMAAFRLQYVAGLTMIDDKVEPAVGFIWLNDDPAHISIVSVNGCMLPSTFYGVDMLQAFRDIGVDVDDDGGGKPKEAPRERRDDPRGTDDADDVYGDTSVKGHQGRRAKDTTPTKQPEAGVSAVMVDPSDRWRLDDYPASQRREILTTVRHVLDSTETMRADAARDVSDARRGFERDLGAMRKRLLWALQCPAAVLAACLLMALFHAGAETTAMLRGPIVLAAIVVFGVLLTGVIRHGRQVSRSRASLLDALARQGGRRRISRPQGKTRSSRCWR